MPGHLDAMKPSISIKAWESTRTPFFKNSASPSICALRNNPESPILNSSAIVHLRFGSLIHFE